MTRLRSFGGGVLASVPVALLALASTGCGAPDWGDAGVTVRDSSGVAIIEVGDPASLRLPEWDATGGPAAVIGARDDRPGHDLFGVRNGAFLSDGRIVVANGGSQELRFFGADGSFLRTIGASGEGPGEFEALAWVGVIPGDTILAYDFATRRLSTFDDEGSFVASVQILPPHEGSFPEVRGAFSNGDLVIVPGFNRLFTQGERRDTVTFILYDRQGRIRDTLATHPGREDYFAQAGGGAMRLEVPFGRDVLASAGGTTFAVGVNDRYEVALVEAGRGAVRAYLRGDPVPRPVTSEEREAWEAERLDAMPDALRERFASALDDLPPRSTHPRFSRLVVAADGSVWIREPVVTGDDHATWVVYDPTGAPAGRATLLADDNVVAIGHDRLLATARDALDRELLRVYDRAAFQSSARQLDR